MKLRRNIILILVLFLGANSLWGQPYRYSLGWWKVESLHGSLMLEGDYRARKTVLKSAFSEKPHTSSLDGRLVLNTRNYVWHPNFLAINLDADITPGRQRDNYVVLPDRAETRIAERLRMQSQLFQKRPLSLGFFTNLGRHTISRDLTTDVEMTTTDYGGNANYRNRFLPLTVAFSRNRWDQKELLTGREFRNERHNLRSEVQRSFGRYDRHRLSYSYDDYRRAFSRQPAVRNYITNVNLQNMVALNENRRSSLNSLIWFTDQNGNQTFRRLQADERLQVQLPRDLFFSGGYQYNDISQSRFDSRQHNFTSRLEHQLYLSLRSQVFLAYNDLSQTGFDEQRRSFGFGLRYRKAIPGGLLNLSYEWRRRNEQRDGQPLTLNIVDERLRLKDGEVALLANPLVDPGSVVLSDETQTVIYVENIDYVLIPRGDFLEVQRIPGGQIADGATVYIDYRAQQQADYQFDLTNRTFAASVALFRQFLEIYYRSLAQDYDNLDQTRFRILKIISQKVYGGRVAYGPFAGGIEWDDTGSNIIPYRSLRYFANLNHQLASRVSAALNASRYRFTYRETDEVQRFDQLSAHVTWMLSRQSRINLFGNYRFQKGRGIDLELGSLRGECSARMRMLWITFGVDLYRRDFLTEELSYQRTYIRLERKF